MKDELEKKLLEKYPKIFRQRNLPMQETCMCWGLACGDGWYNIIDQLCANIQWHIDYHNGEGEHDYRKKWFDKDHKPISQIEAVQVKEKYGGLRFYVNCYESPEIEGMISMAESISNVTCEECGAPGKKNEGGWINTMCIPCRNRIAEIRTERLNRMKKILPIKLSDDCNITAQGEQK